jgi:FkbM family methyltransferase
LRVLIDCGAFTGDSLPALLHALGPFDRIVCFEANAELPVAAPDAFDGAFEVWRAAVWDGDTRLRFFFGEHAEQSSVMAGKRTGNLARERSTMVRAVDFADWIEGNTRPADRLTIKMDIEGAEFDVLERLASHASCRRVEQLLVEWHNNRLRPRWRYRLRRRLIELRYLLKGLPIRIWGRRPIAEAA